ncbi:MAG TPA: DUF4932 domain-containing protein [Sphingomicrobium sp.]|nr:DUF4932 domain-containing protein [Sphingomicrobium sp.]
MNPLISTLAVLAVWQPATAPQQDERMIAQSNVVDIKDGDQTMAAAWTLNASYNPDIYVTQLGRGQRKDVCFISGPNRLCRNVGIGEKHDFVIAHQGVDYPTRVEGKFVPPAAVFDSAYQAAHRGKVTVLIPEVYELVNVAIALTPYVREQKDQTAKYLVMRDSAYHRDLETHFAPVASHPFVLWLDKRLRQGLYARDKMNGYAFEYAADGNIVRSPVYDRTSFNGDAENSLLPALEQMRDFSRKSNFRAFYAKHRDIYEEQIAFMRTGLNYPRMQQWLKREFPKVKPYDHVKIVFSPLVFGSQSVTWLESNGFRELQPHINFPYEQNFKAPVSAEARTLQRGNLLFTETNHGFINPTADPYAGEIAKAVSNRDLWARKGSSADGYGGPQSVFNEYMNWGLVNLFYADHAPSADVDALIELNNKQQSNGRGFVRFPQFSSFLVDLYRKRPAGTTIADLYPQIIAWFAANNAAPAGNAPQSS